MNDLAQVESIRSTDSSGDTGRAASLEANDYREKNLNKSTQIEPDFVTFTNAFDKQNASGALQESTYNTESGVTESASDDTAAKAQPEVDNDPNGKYVEKTWTDGRRERQFQDGLTVTFEKDTNGGVISTMTKDGKTTATEHARMDKDENVIVEYVSASADNNYRAVHGKDGSLTVDWADGKHMERRRDGDMTYTEMTGPNARDNFKATEKRGGGTEVTYADGSGWVMHEGKYEFKNSGLLGELGVLGFADNQNYLGTFWQLNGAFWMSLSQSVADVRKNHR